ncbi:sperm flagellar protein 2-like [Belonocnema kinseyi]|uniref:sperm flagellar protein 2-like n=1 Tax=Belonocnema kinseyi TaxID=2817044 RepID=UPI00143D389A|nr:sperm flagellar protein 2-like [Belonocnema kinseyi]
MSETLKAWFLTRLGVMLDLHPDFFGLFARDGTLMAKILHSYNIINDSQLSTMIPTHDPAVSRVNLKHLKVWLKFIGVDCDDQSIHEISNGKGCTALRLFFKLYLSLENKDRLRFITLQKEREKIIPTYTKFNVTRVSEEPPPCAPSENPLAAPLAGKAKTVQWYREKQVIIDAYKRERKKFKESQKLKSQEKFDESVPKAKLVEVKRSELKDIDDFQRKLNTPSGIYVDPKKKRSRKDLKTSEIMFNAVEEYLKKMKNRRNQESTTKNFKERMQKLLLSEVWEKLLEDQENKFNEIVAEKVLTQSQYEKRMISNLCEIRCHKNQIAENRQIVENLMQNMKEKEIMVDDKSEREIQYRDEEVVEDEYAKLCELQRRMRDEKIRKIKEKHEQACSAIISDLIDISIKTAECLKENGCIPRSLWNEFRALFINHQPIFEPSSVEGNGGESVGEEAAEEVTQFKSERNDALNNFDFNTYHNYESPWDEHLPDIDDETEEILRLGYIVIGYIVHRLLEFLYPYPPDPEPAPIPKVDKSVIVLGAPNQVLVTLQHLLEPSRIKLIFMEDAINYCLKAYKEEMKDIEYVNISPVASGNKAGKPKKDSVNNVAKPTRSKKPSQTKNVAESKFLDKQVQTPKNIPYEDMDPTLSDDAYIGKWAYDFLKLGQPISYQLNTKILIQYLKSLPNIRGWAIVDYPNNYQQMASLESALTGRKLPFINLDSDADDLISTPSRITFEDENSDKCSSYRKSQLVSNPITRATSDSKTFMTGFIRVIPKPKGLDAEDIFEILPEDATPMDTFYATESVAYVLYYSTFDVLTLKSLARLIIGDMSLPRKASAELFGEALKKLDQIQDSTAKQSVVKQIIPKASETFSDNSTYEEEEEVTSEKSELLVEIKPGEEAWEWVSFPQPDEVLEALAVLWENLESVYVSNLKDIFFEKRIHSNAILPYKGFVVNHMESFISRPDIKQEVFKTFYREFNQFDDVARGDSALKCELQCRVADLQTELFEICDQRKKESEEERQRLIQNHWTALQTIALINVYINITQVEIDRCIDTVQMLQDYYTSMLQKPLGNRLPKMLLERLDTPADKATQQLPKVPVKDKTKTKKAKSEFVWEPPAAVDCALIQNELADLLLDIEKSDYELDQNICYTAVKVNIDCVENIVDSIASFFHDMWKNESNPKKSKNKKSRKPSIAASGENLEKYRGLLQEWRYATMSEIKRMKIRLKMLDNAVRSDISFLLDTVQKEFHRLYRELVDRYEREVNSVKEMANEFYLAIEEERSIEGEMFFDGDLFVIKTNKVEEPPLITEEILPFRFKMAQLGHLMDTLHNAAPQGNISRRALFYILMDIISLGAEQDEILLPPAWYNLKTEQVCRIIQELFGSDCDYIEWREFIIYGMEIPMPSTDQLLEAKKVFEAYDPQLKEVITREQFHSVPVWFYNSTEIDPNCVHILHVQSTAEVNQGEEDVGGNFERISGINLPSKVLKTYEEGAQSYASVEDYEHITPGETLRLMLVKKLLSELFLTQKLLINYMDLLFAFCKDEDPKKGLGKALALFMGNQICTSFEDGEKYVAELLKMKRRVAEEHFAKEETKEISKGIVKDLLNSAIQYAEGVIIEEVVEQTGQEILPGDGLVQIQKLDDSESEESQQWLLKGSDSSINTLGNPFSFITKESFATRASIATPFASSTKTFKKLQPHDKRNLIHWIPKEVCLKVLTKRLELFSKDSGILQRIQEELDDVYDSLKDNNLEHEADMVLSHRLVNHSFLGVLLTNISSFTTKYMSIIVSKIVNEEL